VPRFSFDDVRGQLCQAQRAGRAGGVCGDSRSHARQGMVALGRLVLSKRERVIALQPYEKGLLGTTLRYPYEVRKAEDHFCDLPDLILAPEMLTLAEQILHSKASEFDPARFRDRYEEALLARLKAKQFGAVPERRKTFAPPQRVILAS
jgi:DNA end-binding protein Ku